MQRRKRVSYLQQLRFDPRLKEKWWAKYITNIRLVLILVFSIVALGVYSFFNIPRRLNPEVKIPIVVVSTVLTGASPSDVESLVTIPLEDKLDDLRGIDTMTSVSRNNISVITLQYLSTVDGDKALQEVQTAVGNRSGLPEDVQEPVINLLDFEDQPIWTFTITTKADTASLMRFSRQLRERLKDSTKIDRVLMSGFDTQEIQVILDPAKVAEYGVNPFQLSQAVKSATASYPSGSIQTSDSTFSLSIDSDVVGITDVRRLLLRVNGRTFRLGDIATVAERSKINQQKTYLVDNDGAKKAVQFFIFKSKNSNIDTAESEARNIVEEAVGEYKDIFAVTTVMNTAEDILDQFRDLFRDFTYTILLVFALLVVFLGLRQAVISSLTIPLAFLSTFAIINTLGLSLNFLTSFAFLLTLGLLIDDTIVIVAAITRYYLSGRFSATEAGILVWHDFIVPLWSTTITTIWAFVPLLLSTGIIGEFIKSIPIVVTAAMLSSTSIAVFVTLPIMIILLKPYLPGRVRVLVKVLVFLIILGLFIAIIPKSSIYPVVLIIFFIIAFVVYQLKNVLLTRLIKFLKHFYLVELFSRFNYGFLNIERLSERYKIVIERTLISSRLRRSILAGIVVFAVVGYSLVPLGLVRNEFFPKTDEDILYISVELPPGTNLSSVNTEMLDFVKRISRTEGVSYFIADTGVGLGMNLNRAESSSSFLLTLHLIPDEERDISSKVIAEKLREQLRAYTRGTVNVIELSAGPPAGADIQISILGDDLATLNNYADEIQSWLKSQPGLVNVQSSVKASTSKIVFVPDKNRLAEINMTPDSLGLWLRTYASGFTLDTIKIDNDDTDITFLLGTQAQNPSSLSSILVPTQSGPVQLLSLGKLRLSNNLASIVRQNGKRVVTVTAGVAGNISSTEKNREVEVFVDGLNLPTGYSWETGGINEENQKSVQSILSAMFLSFILILVTMVIEFGSYRQTLIALLIIPIGVSGVFYIFALFGIPLSFPALIGILALFGIVVKQAIIVIEKINDNRRYGMNLYDSLIDAAGSRLEPVLLTSLTTIAGLIPITYSNPLWRGLGGAIIAGLLFSGSIMLFFLPLMYYEWFRDKKSEAKSI